MFLNELVKLATETSFAVVLLLVVGVVFCFIEALIPSFGFWGISGILSTISGIVLHAFVSGSALQVLFILIILALIFTLITLVFIKSAKYGLLARLSLSENKATLPQNNQLQNSFVNMVGKVGKTVADCKPVGKIEVDGEIFEASSKAEFISANEQVFVTEVLGNIIYIEKHHKKGGV